jgi:Bacterial membrane protein YfhO
LAVQAGLVTLLTLGIDDWRIALGRVPLPMDVITASFPAWQDAPHRIPHVLAHQEMGDQVLQDLPWRLFTANHVRHGDVPLWMPRILFGHPWLANFQSAIFSPLAVPYYLLAPVTAWSFEFPLRQLLAGVFMALLCHRLGADRGPAIAAGVAFAGGGFIQAWNGLPITDVALWLPLGLLLIEILRDRPTVGPALGLAATVAAAVLAGHPQTISYVLIFFAAFATFRLVTPGRSDALIPLARWRFASLVGGAAVLAVGLTAVQWIPSLEWLSSLDRTPNVVYGWHLPIGDVVGLVSRDISHTPNSAGLISPDGATYLGVLTVLAAVFSVRHPRRAYVIFFAVVLALGAMATFGLPPVYGLTKVLPIIKGAPKRRMLFFVDSCMPILASFGLTAALRSPTGQRSWRDWGPWAIGSAVLGLLIGGLVLRIRHHHGAIGGLLHGVPSVALLAAVAVALLAPPVVRRLTPGRLAAAAVSLMVIDLSSFGLGFRPLITQAEVFPVPPVLTELRQRDASVYRVATLDTSMPINYELAYGLDTPSGYEYLSRDAARFLDGMGHIEVGFDFRSGPVVATTDRRLDLLNVKYLFTSDYNASDKPLLAHPERFSVFLKHGHITIFENRRVLAREFLVADAGIRWKSGRDSALALIKSPSFDPSTTVTLTPSRGAVDRTLVASAASVATPHIPRAVTELNRQDASLDLQVAAPSASVLVVSEADYPGWVASVDGRRVPIERADSVFQGIAVPAGGHHVHLAYHPASYRRGLFISFAALGLLGSLVVYAAVSRYRAAPTPKTRQSA